MKKKTAKNVLYYVVLAVLVAVFCFSAYKIYSYYAEKGKAPASMSLWPGSIPFAKPARLRRSISR